MAAGMCPGSDRVAMSRSANAEAVRTPAQLDETVLAVTRASTALRDLNLEDLAQLGSTEWIEMPAGSDLFGAQEGVAFWLIAEGQLAIYRQEAQYEMLMMTLQAGDTFGEVPLLLGRRSGGGARVIAKAPCRLLKIPEQGFWNLIAHCPAARSSILADHSRRYETWQAMALHREKLISLGTLAAGLMHELNNPGSAAKRAAAQLRENISRLQQISLRMARSSLGPEQMECVAALQEHVLSLSRPLSLPSIEQSDREEELCEWLEAKHVENAWRLAPTMVGAGWTCDDIACAGSSFPPAIFSDVLNYLEALISSMQHVGTIEESISRVTDLVVAVKKYAYDDKNKKQAVDVRESLLSTLTILGHKFRQKAIQIERDLPPVQTRISCIGAGLAQVWTNLLDNAIDAAPENGHIKVRLWAEDEWVCVGICDNGPGIPQEHREHIFEPFYTTKEAGVGTGLGLDIAHRIVVGNFHGEIRFTTAADGTEFVVKLPLATDETGAGISKGCSVSQG